MWPDVSSNIEPSATYVTISLKSSTINDPTIIALLRIGSGITTNTHLPSGTSPDAHSVTLERSKQRWHYSGGIRFTHPWTWVVTEQTCGKDGQLVRRLTSGGLCQWQNTHPLITLSITAITVPHWQRMEVGVTLSAFMNTITPWRAANTTTVHWALLLKHMWCVLVHVMSSCSAVKGGTNGMKVMYWKW